MFLKHWAREHNIVLIMQKWNFYYNKILIYKLPVKTHPQKVINFNLFYLFQTLFWLF